MKYGTAFIVALEVDEKFLNVESHSVTLVNWQTSTSPSNVFENWPIWTGLDRKMFVVGMWLL